MVCVLVLIVGCNSDDAPTGNTLRLATTTSTRDSGLLDQLLPPFAAEHGLRIDVIAVGTGKALKLGEAGDVDVVLVHARQAEQDFMAAGHGVRREEVMHNTFELLGPPDDPAKIRDLGPAEALKQIAEHGQRFVSRGDDSGTHKRELLLWENVGGRPNWPEYVETGQGMGATLNIADQMLGYVLTDRGTYLHFRDKIDLEPLAAPGPGVEERLWADCSQSGQASGHKHRTGRCIDRLLSIAGGAEEDRRLPSRRRDAVCPTPIVSSRIATRHATHLAGIL